MPQPSEPAPAVGSFDHMVCFAALYEAHRAARRGKGQTHEVLAFEADLAANLCALSEELVSGTYRPGPYAHFVVREPKVRQIFAPSYRDRVVQHALCDTVLAPALDKRLIYDNAACRVGKGTSFALDRLALFLREHFHRHGPDGYVLKLDVHHYFASIRHDVLLAQLGRVFRDERVRSLLGRVVASYEESPGVGLPLGNQASQWFALLYLDPLDRLVKERLGVRAYTRYMDDAVLIHPSKPFLDECLATLRDAAAGVGLRLNAKTQVFPLSAGIRYLGFHSRLTPAGRVVRRLSRPTKVRLRRSVRRLQAGYAAGALTAPDVRQGVAGYLGHLGQGDTYALRRAILRPTVWLGVEPATA